MPQPLQHVTIEPRQPATASVIWLHGLGADGHDFSPIVPQLQLAREDIRFIFPHAPHIPVTLNFGMTMPAWFDIMTLDREQGIDFAGAERSALAVQCLIEEQEAQGIASDKIVIMGFSQGGSVALFTGLLYPKTLAGIGALSTFLPRMGAYNVQPHAANQKTSILFCHGSQDGVIPLRFAKETVTDLTQSGYNVQWHEYVMAHTVCQQEIDDISQWLKTVLA